MDSPDAEVEDDDAEAHLHYIPLLPFALRNCVGGGDVVPAGFEGVCGSGIGRQSWKWRDERCLGFVSGLEWMGEG